MSDVAQPSWTLHLGDGIAGMAALADSSVDHVVTDPPYESEAHTLQRRLRKETLGDGDRVLAVEPLGFAPIQSSERIDCGLHFGRVAKRWTLVFCQVEAAMTWRDSIAADYARTMVWVKPDGMPQLTGDRPGMGYESIVVCHAPGRKRWNGGGRVGVYSLNKSDGERVAHPTQKPIPLMEALIRDFTDPGDLVLDPFAGSGTTGVACIRLGRRFIGWERDPKYHAIAMKRLEAAREQLVLPMAKQPRARQESLIK